MNTVSAAYEQTTNHPGEIPWRLTFRQFGDIFDLTVEGFEDGSEEEVNVRRAATTLALVDFSKATKAHLRDFHSSDDTFENALVVARYERLISDDADDYLQDVKSYVEDYTKGSTGAELCYGHFEQDYCSYEQFMEQVKPCKLNIFQGDPGQFIAWCTDVPDLDTVEEQEELRSAIARDLVDYTKEHRAVLDTMGYIEPSQRWVDPTSEYEKLMAA